MTDVVALCAEMLSIQSPTGGESKIVDFVSRRLVSRGWNVTVQEVTPGRGNVWASRGGGGVTLSTHLDTVPPYVAPKLDGERLYGRWEFKPVFEKDLKALVEKLPGKPDVKLTDWFTIINGGAIKWTGGDKDTATKLKAALEKLSYVKTVELDIPTPPPGK